MASLGTVRELISVEDPVPATMSLERYLRSIFHPDCDFVDGRIEERNVGEYEHSIVQKMLMRLFGDREREWGVICVPECRLQVATTRCRVPDVMVLHGGKKYSGVIQDAPLLCIEVLSPEDTWARMRKRLDDYLRMGVVHVWCFEPEAREVRRYTAEGFVRVAEPELTIPGTAIRIRVTDVFSALDQQ